jgi:hypothetical protein
MPNKKGKIASQKETVRPTNVKECALHFYRSTNLDRDFYSEDALAKYYLTDSLRGYMTRIINGLRKGSTLRAWRIVGPYGCGKSSFALALARHLSGPSFAKNITGVPKAEVDLTPILVTCSKAPLADAVITGVEKFCSSRRGRTINALKKTYNTTTEQALACIQSLFERGDGVLLILDELGKALEYAALNPDKDDVFLLQQLAEMASRNQDKPFVLITLLHQNVSAYADRLGHATIREWEKVAGRFEEISFEQSFIDNLSIVSQLLGSHPAKLSSETVKTISGVADVLLDENWVSGKLDPKTLKVLFQKLYPLHPTFVPVLFKFMQRFVQNERSVYGFLFANEPFGLQSFNEHRIKDSEFYGLADFYDYIRANQIYRLDRAAVLTRWAHIESMVDKVCESEAETKLLKSVAVLNLLDDQAIRPTNKMLEICLPVVTSLEVRHIIDRLRKDGTLFNRGRAGGYCLWPNTSVNLDDAMKRAEEENKTTRVAGLIEKYLPKRPILARRHYIEKGNFRWFEVSYCSSDMLQTTVNNSWDSGDGQIIYVLCENDAEILATKNALNDGTIATADCVLVGVTRSLADLGKYIDSVRRWEWIEKHTDGLANDDIAKKVVFQQLESAKADLAQCLDSYIGLSSINNNALTWYRKGQKIKIENIQSIVSSMCDECFYDAPTFKHEILNRQALTSAGSAAQMRLIEAMFHSEGKPFFGMDESKRPPEMSMYLAFFKKGKVHQERRGFWQVCVPADSDDPLNLRPAFLAVEKYLHDRPDQCLPVLELVDFLASPTYGVRAGLAYLIIAIILLINQHDLAIYYKGSFVSEIHKETLAGIVKAARLYEVQYCKIEGVRRDVFKKIALNLGFNDPDKTELLDVAAKLCRFKAGLPEYTLKTRQVGMVAQAVRAVISEAREPIKFIFHDLPMACGQVAFTPGTKIPDPVLAAYVGTLKDAVDELQHAYDELKKRMKVKIAKAFGLSGDFQKMRVALSKRALPFVESVAEIKLKGFAIRLILDDLPDSEWLESVGDFVIQKTPQKWNDVDEGVFEQELLSIAGRFLRTEAIGFNLKNKDKAYRLFITEQSGKERGQVLFLCGEQRENLVKCKQEVIKILGKVDQETRLAVISEWLWEVLPSEVEKE